MNNDFINIKFSYNGDLGKLQHQTQANMHFVYELRINKIITNEEHENYCIQILEFFKQELEYITKNYIQYGSSL